MKNHACALLLISIIFVFSASCNNNSITITPDVNQTESGTASPDGTTQGYSEVLVVNTLEDEVNIEISLKNDKNRLVSVVLVKSGSVDWEESTDNLIAIDQLTLDGEGRGKIAFSLDHPDSYTVIITADSGVYRKEVVKQ